MRAKTINESQNFERRQDPKKALDLGIKSGEDWATMEIKKAELDSDDFWEKYSEGGREASNYELLDTIDNLIEKLSLEEQIDWYREDVESYIKNMSEDDVS